MENKLIVVRNLPTEYTEFLLKELNFFGLQTLPFSEFGRVPYCLFARVVPHSKLLLLFFLYFYCFFFQTFHWQGGSLLVG
jgi:hypothetical protein